MARAAGRAEGFSIEGALIALPAHSAFSTLKRKASKMIEGLFQPTHLAILLAIAVLIFGGRKLPELGQGLGKGIRGFKDALRGIDEVPDETGAKTKAQN
jgi:sec-independent protein translocase protein TatA